MDLKRKKSLRKEATEMSKFGDLIRGVKAPTPAAPTAPAPVSVPTPEAKSFGEEVLITPEEKVLTEASPLEQMTKKELEALGRSMGIELDRRHSKASLIEELKEVEGE